LINTNALSLSLRLLVKSFIPRLDHRQEIIIVNFFIPVTASPVEEFRIPPMTIAIAAAVAAIIPYVGILQISLLQFPAPVFSNVSLISAFQYYRRAFNLNATLAHLQF